jgi:hypothetical protein
MKGRGRSRGSQRSDVNQNLAQALRFFWTIKARPAGRNLTTTVHPTSYRRRCLLTQFARYSIVPLRICQVLLAS